MGHDRRAGGVLVGQLDETEILRIVEAGVESQARHRGCYSCQRVGNRAFRLAASHLRIDHVVVHRFKTKQTRGHLAVERE